ncbi:hypothetical protein NFI96_004556 [Prochilodus magdalenae]|nr:hypothetical protein NFI96_004556 [Prochilodus magdalenae]
MKRTAVVALQLLLLLMVLLQNSLQESEDSDALQPSDELKYLRGIMYKLGTALSELKTEMKSMEKENTALKTKQIKETKEVQNNMEILKKELSGVKVALNALQKENTEPPKVAFSAALTKTVGPLSADSDLVFPRVFMNIGGAYNPKTGFFTAPVRGVYHFHFTLCSQDKEPPKVVFSAALTEKVGPDLVFPSVTTNMKGAYNPNTGVLSGGGQDSVQASPVQDERVPHQTRSSMPLWSLLCALLLLLELLQNSLQDTEVADALKPSDELKQLKDIMYQLGTALAELKTEMKYMEKENTGVKAVLNALQKENTEPPKVAFSAALTEKVGPLSNDSDLVFSKVITNIGGAYNTNTGYFTAPVRGGYYFCFTITCGNKGYYSGMRLYKNNDFLLLLFQNNLQETEAVEALKSLKPSNELKQLKDIVYQQGTALAELKAEMKYIEKENTGLKAKLAKQIKLTKEAQNNMENLKKEFSAQTKELSAAKTRLLDSEGEVKNLKNDSAAIFPALKGRMSTNEGDMESLKREVLELPKVAFSAALTATVTDSNGDADLVFSHVITNIGGGYNPKTGVFTAPTRGVYYFRFTVWCYNSGYYTGIYLYKNNDVQTYLYTYNYDGYGKFISGGVTVQLEVGDTVRTKIPKDYYIYHTGTNPNIFSGFMLFTI